MHERGRARPRGDHGPGRGRCLAGKRPEKASAALESIETISRTAQDELRVVLGLLRDGEAAHPPTAVVIANIASAIGAVRAAHLAGMHVPAQVSVVSVHDLPLVGYLEPPLTTVRMPVEEPGCRGIEVLSAYLPPIDHPRGLMMKLAYFFTRRQLGKVITPVRVHSARMPPAFGSCYFKMQKLDQVLRLPRETSLLIRQQVASINMCMFCMDATRFSALREPAGNQARFDGLPQYRTSPLFTDAERAALDYATKLAAGKQVRRNTVDRLARYYSERETCDIVWLVASEHLNNMTNIGLAVGSDGLCQMRQASQFGRTRPVS
jgi:hypothetical protein